MAEGVHTDDTEGAAGGAGAGAARREQEVMGARGTQAGTYRWEMWGCVGLGPRMVAVVVLRAVPYWPDLPQSMSAQPHPPAHPLHPSPPPRLRLPPLRRSNIAFF